MYVKEVGVAASVDELVQLPIPTIVFFLLFIGASLLLDRFSRLKALIPLRIEPAIVSRPTSGGYMPRLRQEEENG